MVGQHESLRNLPDDAEVRRHVDSLAVRIAGRVKDTLPHIVEAVEIFVVVGEVHRAARVAHIAIHLNVLDTRTLEAEFLGWHKRASWRKPGILKVFTARRVGSGRCGRTGYDGRISVTASRRHLIVKAQSDRHSVGELK